MEINELQELVCQFRDKRNWKQFHNAKDMALSLSLEASELLELTQWKSEQEANRSFNEDNSALSDELADVFYWVLLISRDFNINLNQALRDKIKKNELKYPVNLSKDSKKKYVDLE